MKRNIEFHAPKNMTLGEQRQFNTLVRVHRLSEQDAVRAIENQRRRNAIAVQDVVESYREQANRRTVVGSHERVTA